MARLPTIGRMSTGARRIEPIAPDRTLDVLQIYYFDERALSDELASVRTQRTETWKEVFIEDLGVVEGMQRGRRSPAFDGGRFSGQLQEHP